jgi:uncharacterized protein
VAMIGYDSNERDAERCRERCGGSGSSSRCSTLLISCPISLYRFPSVGKSTILSTLTETKSETASYEFTTLTCIPGVLEVRATNTLAAAIEPPPLADTCLCLALFLLMQQHQGSKIQLLDMPGIIEGASEGKGRGRQVIAVAKTADLVLMMLDASKGDVQRALLERELEAGMMDAAARCVG